MTITKTEDEIKELLDSECGEVIDEEGGKHDCTNKRYLFDIDCKKFAVWLSFSYNDGLQIWGDTDLQEVEAVEIKKTEWRVVA